MKKILLLITALIVALDLWFKSFIENMIPLGKSITMIPDFFDLMNVRNTGAAWSMLSGARVLFLVLTPIVCAGLIYYFIKKEDVYQLTAISLILAGALGNYYDRVVFGYVRDMFAFNIFGYNFPVFNIADSAVSIGVGILIVLVILEEMGLYHEQTNN